MNSKLATNQLRTCFEKSIKSLERNYPEFVQKRCTFPLGGYLYEKYTYDPSIFMRVHVYRQPFGKWYRDPNILGTITFHHDWSTSFAISNGDGDSKRFVLRIFLQLMTIYSRYREILEEPEETNNE